MIGFFPDPYPDELLYSICARFQNLVQYSNSELLVQELFGIRHARAVVGLPSHLGHLVATIPSGHRYTVDRLIDEATLLPFYSPFLPPDRVRSVREQMGGSGSNIHCHIGISSTIRSPAYLQFCPLCAVKDKEQLGERYWHRLHQVPGVEVCPTHAVFLEKSSVCPRTQINPYNFISAEQAIQVTSWRLLDLSDPCHEKLLKLAYDAAWLLKQHGLVFSLQSIRDRYMYLLPERGLATYSGRVHQGQLLKAFKNSYPLDLLQLLQSELDEEIRANWLCRLVWHSQGSHHPLHHLLLIHFLGHTAETFFKLPSEFKPFGEGPWSCLNPVCKHFRKAQIQECKINYNSRDGMPLGIFSCKCGFVYSSNDFDQSTTGDFRVSTVKSYGPLWESVLKELWENSSLSLQEIGHRLGVGRTKVKNYAIALQLSFPRLGPTRQTQIGAQQQHRLAKKQLNVPNRLEIYRNEWLSLLNENPDASRTSLRRQADHIYGWLRRRDSEWLEAHLPQPRKNNGSRSVDWESRDVQLAKAVRQSAIRLKSATGCLVKITKRAISKDINQIGVIQNYLNKLPLTAQALNEVVETREEYVVRYTRWAVECLELHDTKIKCPRCESDQISKNGWQGRKQNHICQECNFQFVESGFGKGYSSETRKHCLNLHVNGLGFRAIERMTGVKNNTVARWIKQATTPLPEAPE
ncbi:TniQ family protein [Microcoleus sp. FACHB-SPT15]|uniref:TnsD family Tn7-like transposition protein n=1 Tax=Microcoleus sp. FACHB-SPT15 TaxID=2692830 RepID=UPI0017877314|nr:TnsD family Tn7-like transposition protein [Microcoleus sp. FACHB-SPT15]MBD1808116.1 TniQ family protein [Microcoleus sp. FACHB-SPT15]